VPKTGWKVNPEYHRVTSGTGETGKHDPYVNPAGWRYEWIWTIGKDTVVAATHSTKVGQLWEAAINELTGAAKEVASA
jgi:hypothetical protein